MLAEIAHHAGLVCLQQDLDNTSSTAIKPAFRYCMSCRSYAALSEKILTVDSHSRELSALWLLSAISVANKAQLNNRYSNECNACLVGGKSIR